MPGPTFSITVIGGFASSAGFGTLAAGGAVVEVVNGWGAGREAAVPGFRDTNSQIKAAAQRANAAAGIQ